MAARATKLRPGAGRMVSARSKTGDPLCSQAMSAFQLILRGATAAVSMTKEQASKILGQCRSKARAARQGALARNAGREALAQHLEARAARSASEAHSGPARAARARQLLEVRAGRNAARAARQTGPAPSPGPSRAPSAIGAPKPGEKFALRTRAAVGTPRAQNTGKGRTPYMCDMKRGDKPGQMSIMDKVRTEDTRPLHAQALDAARKVPDRLRMGHSGKVFIHHAWQQYRKDGGRLSLDQFKRELMASPEGRMMTSRADLVQGMRPGDVKASHAEHMGGEKNFIRTDRPGGSGPIPREHAAYYRPAPKEERGVTAAVVGKVRGARAQAAQLRRLGRQFGVEGKAAEDLQRRRRLETIGKRAVLRGKRDARAYMRREAEDTRTPQQKLAQAEAERKAAYKALDDARHRARTEGTPASREYLAHAKRRYELAQYSARRLKGITPVIDKTPAARPKREGSTKTQRAKMAAAVREIHRQSGKPVKDLAAAVRYARGQAALGRRLGDPARAHRWEQHARALEAHVAGGKAPKAGGWNLPPAAERSAAADLVARARAKSAPNIQRRDLAPGDRVEVLHRIPPKEAMGPRRSKTAAAIREQRGKLRRFEEVATHGKAGDTGYVPTKALHFDPERFQYKQSAQGKHGVTDQFKETKKWNPELAGVISVWRDPADHKLYVVNGHHRADLAQRLKVDKLRVQLINARDASEARAKGAIENIGEGRGTAYDAAKFLREHGIGDRAELEKFGVSLSEHTAKRGLDLAGLHPKLWKDYEAGALPEERAAMIGGAGLSHPQQESLIKSIKRGTNNATVRELIDNAHAAGRVKQQTRDLFGTSEEEVSLAHHRAAAQAHVRESLLADKKLYGLVSKSKAAQSIEERGAGHIKTEAAGEIGQQSRELLDLFDRLKNRSGPVAAALNDAQERLHAGQPKKAVFADLRKRVIEEMERVLRGGSEAFAA